MPFSPACRERATEFFSLSGSRYLELRAELYPIADCPIGRLAVMPRPRGGDWLEGEAASWRQQGLDTVVSLLADTEIAELGLIAEQSSCESAGLKFVRFPIADRGVPSTATGVSELVSALLEELRAGRSVGIHCRMGIGRSASLAVCLLSAAGLCVETAWAAVERARGMPVPDTAEQRAWVESWCAGFNGS
jgi:protein-tyrosine phosphatase